MAARIVLASASPRRRALLLQAGLGFLVRPADVDETLPPGTSPVEGACGLARRKALAVARTTEGRAWVVGADTVVAAGQGAGGERLLGKPEDEAEARAMLAALSGTRHRVVTAVSVVTTPTGACLVDAETTWVRMRVIDAVEIAAYVRSGEWRDKAGGYAIQETADRFVLGLEGGGFDNVVGLPVGLTLALLERAGAPDLPARRS